MIGIRKLAVLLTGVVASSLLLSACSKEEPAQAPAASADAADSNPSAAVAKFGEQPLAYSFYSNYDFASPIGYGNDVTTKWLKENKKLNLIEIGSNGNAKQKFGAMVASNDLPDVIMLDRGSSEYTTMQKNGMLVPLDDYYKKYPVLQKLVDPQTYNMLKAEDGHIYVIPNWFDSAQNEYKYSNTGWTVNRKIYAELGKPELKTYDDLYNYLKQVKAKYPDVVPLEPGMTLSGINMLYKLLYAGFGDNRTIWNIGDVPSFPNMKTSTLEPIFNDSAYKDAYKFLNKLYKEGLVTQDMFTQKLEQVQEKLNTGRIAVTGFSNITGQGNNANAILQAKDPNAGYDFIPFLYNKGVDPKTVNPHTYGTLGWNVNVITKKAKNPEQIFQFYDWWAGEDGQRINAFGPPGLLYDKVDENGAPIDNEKAKTISPQEKANLKFGLFNPEGSWLFYKIGHFKNAQNPNAVNWGNAASEFFGSFAKLNADQFNNMSLDPKSDIGIKEQQIKQLWYEANAKMVFAKTDEELEAVYKKLQADVTKVGYETVLAEKTKIWKSNLDKMK
ncbi:extracellular solute-binding protein [Bacillus sp. 3255]|uniref:extracellular solute-binding protein n=1 Tax=Bacillus sp. 3255 TaxID=2817904 RepID=UPI00285AE84F|nr:extracellular solute-binding protein [Bacillus sp. 3255]MDR6879465.1 putative aldouronate transport system substrate-binding protein [Bacillus sp. 3255]